MFLGQVNEQNYNEMSHLFPKEMHELIDERDVYLYVAFETLQNGSAPLGVCAIRTDEGIEGITCALLWIYVPREYRLQGVGSFLLTELKTMLLNYGAVELYASFEAAEQTEGLSDYLSKSGFVPDAENDTLSFYLSEQTVRTQTVDEALMDMHPDMSVMLPRFFRLEQMLEQAEITYAAEADRKYGPFFILSYEDGVWIRLYTLSDPEDPEKSVIAVSSDLSLANRQEDEIEAILSEWEEQSEIAQADFSIAADVVSTNAFYPYDPEEETSQMFYDFLEAFHAETAELKRLAEKTES